MVLNDLFTATLTKRLQCVKFRINALVYEFLYEDTVIDPKHLAWLAEIADLGSLSHAARKLNLTQPTLTRAVQIVEDRVGSKVFERERRGMRPTRVGERLVEVGRNILANRSQAEEIVDLWRQGLDRSLRVGVGPMFAASFMGEFFAEIIARRPNYSLFVETATASRLIERLNEGGLDIVLAPEQISLFQDDLIQHKLMRDELAIFAGSGNSLTRRHDLVTSEELEDQIWITVGALSGIYGSTKDVMEQLNIRHVSATISFTGDILMAADILRRTSAICVLPRYLTLFSNNLQGIAPVNFRGDLPSRDVVLWARRVDYELPDIQDFHSRLVELIGHRTASPDLADAGSG